MKNPEQLAKWKEACGDNILDFGAGHGDEAKILQKAGITVTRFEPYPLIKEQVSRVKGRQSAMDFLAAVRKKTEFSAIFLSSVLNSVPFPEDREHILRIVASLATIDTPVFVAARGTHDINWRSVNNGEAVNKSSSRTCLFPLSSKKGTALGDLASSPKLQKYFEVTEFQELLSQFFGDVTVAKESSMVIATCRKPLHIRPQDLAESLRFEFNLPYADGKRMELNLLALKTFSFRLGLDLENLR